MYHWNFLTNKQKRSLSCRHSGQGAKGVGRLYITNRMFTLNSQAEKSALATEGSYWIYRQGWRIGFKGTRGQKIKTSQGSLYS